MKLIERLTAEQEAQLVPLRDQWLAHGLSTQPADRASAEEGVRLAYQAAGLEPPRIIIWLDSPLAGCIGAAMLAAERLPGAQVRDQVQDRVRDQVRNQVRAQVGDQVWGQVWAQVKDRAGDQVQEQVEDQIGDQVWDQVSARVGAQVGAQVQDQVRAQVWDQVWDQIWNQVQTQILTQVQEQVRDQVVAQVQEQVADQVYHSARGQHDAWLSGYAYFNHIGLTCTDRMLGLLQIVRSAGWWWPFAGAAILTERPTALHRDEQNRLHHETGPALLYPDGFAVYAWHGTRVPADLLEGNGWAVERILSESNQEIRRCAIERIGWDTFIDHARLAPVGPAEPDPGNPGNTITLYDVPDQFFDEPVRILLCTNGTVERDGTRRRFGLTVPGHIGDPTAAAAWTYGWTAAQYRQLEHRR